MIFVRDKGQMCNNILQYAHVYAWAREHGRHCMSMRFAYKYQYFHICSTRYHNPLYYIVGKFLAACRLIPVVTYDERITDPAMAERFILDHRNVMVEGWGVRHFELFQKYLPDIRRLFDFNPGIRQPVQSLLQAAPSPGLPRLGVHIRRGDYATWFDGKFLFSDEEYLAYIRRSLELLGPRRFNIYICGNTRIDRQWFASRLSDRADVFFPDGNPAEDLCLLSECDYLLGPLSTFSLVASMYGRARLCWMYSHDLQTPIEFLPFLERLPQLDTLWHKAYTA